jgi:hypothetical protein
MPVLGVVRRATGEGTGQCYLRLERLREMGHELRRPEADFLRDGIYELRVSLGGFITGYCTSSTARRQPWSLTVL